MFNNPELQKIYEESQPIIEEHLRSLDKISDDIKNLEILLKHAGGEGFKAELRDKDGILQGSLQFLNGRLRHEFIDDHLSNTSIPLIEKKVATRIKMAKYLPDFLIKFFEAIK